MRTSKPPFLSRGRMSRTARNQISTGCEVAVYVHRHGPRARREPLTHESAIAERKFRRDELQTAAVSERIARSSCATLRCASRE